MQILRKQSRKRVVMVAFTVVCLLMLFIPGPGAKDLYDATTNSFLATSVSGLASFTLPADSAAVVVLVPANGTISYDGNKTLINGVVVDYITPPKVSITFPIEAQRVLGAISRRWMLKIPE